MILLQTQTGEGETIETLWKGETVRISVRLLRCSSNDLEI